MAEYVRDTFTRSSGSGWGNADVGGAWTQDLVGCSAAVTGTAGQIQIFGTVTGKGDSRAAAATAARDVAAAVAIITQANWTADTVITLYLRASAASTIASPVGYWARATFKPDGSIVLAEGYAAPAETQLATITYPAGTWVTGQTWQLEAQANGAPTKLRARLYRPAAGIPAGANGWLVAGDEAGPQVAGIYQLRAARATIATATTVLYDALYVSDIPAPAFTYTATGLAATFATTGTTGDFTAYAWAWGDGTAAGSGSTPSHTYAAAGTYLVTLTGTTRWGATFTYQQYVAVAAPPPEPPDVMPLVLIDGVDVCDEVYSITWNLGRSTWADTFAGQTCTIRLRGQYPALQGMPVTVSRPAGTSGAPLWVGTVDQVTEQIEIDEARRDTLVSAMDVPSFLGRWHMPPATILPATSGLAPRLLDLAPTSKVIYRAKWPGVPGSRYPALKKKTQGADKLRERTHLDLVRDALAASIAFAYGARNGDIVYGPWDAPAGVVSTPAIDVDTGIDCAARVTLDRNSLDAIVNRWTVGSGDVLDVFRRSSIEAYGERSYTVGADVLSSDTGLPITDAMVLAMADPVRSATAEVPIVDWAQKAINLEPLDLALCRGTLMAVMGVRHEYTITEGWRATITLDRNPWATRGAAPP